VPIQPVKRTRAYEQIVTQLVDMIRQGSWKPGDRLPSERELAQSFGVGRPTLRQALTVLAEAGVVEIVPGSGVYLRRAITNGLGQSGSAMAMLLMTENKDLIHMLELRVAIESEAAYLAALRRQSVHVRRLREALAALEQAFHERQEAAQEDYRFHCAVAEATQNPVFVKVMVSLADLFMQGLHETNRTFYREPGRIESNLREHRAIMDAIIAQRPEEARLAMSHHLRRIFERLRRAHLAGQEAQERA